ncbi:MAG: 1-(5-phosphoribosyl)-5-[(5-phosphoribosylamino)methylideneamino]imidazole-4-carboxamide isomerase [Chloroflexota bacterium]|nr:1-(5-phosphoribosyl)-5-[(5-phosphoribosylamino)methylideneamino]imidazole-4-carboxamide isomerase [Chloroflexota bacterium]
MEVIPAIDLRGNKCVRLYQGDYGQETVFSEDPISMALHWEELGGNLLHLVDLDGAATGKPQHIPIIREITRRTKMRIEVGGGIRDPETIDTLLQIGVQRVILGTTAVSNRDLVTEIVIKYKEAVVIGVDAKDGFVATRGWREQSLLAATDFVSDMAALGARRFIYTDISRDGTLTEPNFEATAELVRKTNLPIIASGGVSSIDHLRKLSKIGVEGAIVGKALYTEDIDLRDAIRAMRGK